MVRGTRELIAGLVRDPQFGPCVMLGVGGVLAEALGDVAFRLVPLDRASTPTSSSTTSRPQTLLGPFRGEPAVDRAVARRGAHRPVAARSRSPRRRRGRRQPAHRRRRHGRSRSTRSSSSIRRAARNVERRAASADASTDADGFARAVRAARRRSSPARRRIRASSGSSRCTTSSPRATRARSARRTSRAAPVLGIDTVREHRRPARRPVGPRVRVHARRRERRPAPRVRAARASAPRSSRARATARRATRAARAERELVALADELGILLAGPNGQGVVSTPAQPVRADRRAVPARRAGSRSRASRATSCRRSRTGPCRPASA